MSVSCSSTSYGGVLPFTPHPRTHFNSQNFAQFSSLRLSTKTLLPKLQISRARQQKCHALPTIFAAQSNFFKVIQTAFKIGKDGVEAGTNLVPDAVPRPIARIAVTGIAAALSLFVLRSFLSTVFFAMGFAGFVYFVFLALNKDKGPKLDSKPGSTDEAIEEAKKIMDKYK